MLLCVLCCTTVICTGLYRGVRLTCALCRDVLCCVVLRSADPYTSERHRQQDVSQGIFGPEFNAFRQNGPLQQHKYRPFGLSSEPTASVSSLNAFEDFAFPRTVNDDQPASQGLDLELEQEQEQEQLQEQTYEPYQAEAANEPGVDREQELAEQYAREDYEHRQQAAAEAEEAEAEMERRLLERQMLASAEPTWQESRRRQENEATEEQMRAYETLARQEEERRQQIQAEAEELEQPFPTQQRLGNVRHRVAADEQQRETPKKHATHDDSYIDKEQSEAEELRRAFNVDWPQHTKQQALCWQ